MIKYAKIVNEETGLVEVGIGTNTEFYQSIGMKKLDVKQSEVDSLWYLSELCPMKSDEQKELEEKERIAQLNMTRGDFFEGLILSVGKDEDDVLALIDVIELTEAERKIYKSRVKNALDFYRGYPLIDMMCGYLGINPDNMTLFFETRDYTHLIPIPEEPTVPETEEPDGEIPNNGVGDTTTTDTTTV